MNQCCVQFQRHHTKSKKASDFAERERDVRLLSDMEMLDHAEYICRAIARHSSAGNAATDSSWEALLQ